MVIVKRRVSEASETTPRKKAKPAFTHIFAAASDDPSSRQRAAAAVLPARRHTLHYHRPELLDHEQDITRLLQWYHTVSRDREMPWRQEWLDPSSASDDAFKTRAYQVWISEIMLQQTRVETVKTFYTNWMSKWPSIEQLASAPAEGVLAAWRGLGYYSRATRIHHAAQKVVADPSRCGLLPQTPDQLQKEVPGVGPYTAGAISSIVFGHAVPILDGNVARVLSRQMALYANPKSKATTDVLWAAADVLVQHAVSVVNGNCERSAVPGQWNQALMELGSTVCTPTKPQCTLCPINNSCMAYREASAIKTTAVQDIEDLCTLCEPMAFQDDDEEQPSPSLPMSKPVKPKMRQATLPFNTTVPAPQPPKKGIHGHVQRFPMKLEKQKVRREECLVVIVHDGSRMLIQQRPSTGLLASMWQFPALTMSTVESGDDGATHTVFPAQNAHQIARTYITETTGITPTTTTGKDLGSITHLFSHLHLTMHVRLFRIAPVTSLPRPSTTGELKNKNFGSSINSPPAHVAQRWATAEQIEAESMGTGMRNVWLLVQQHI